MNVLPFTKQVEVISALSEGMSIRATELLTGIHRDTIMRLGVRVGTGCAAVHNALMRDLHVNRLELDEAWSFVGKKQRFTTPEDVARNSGDTSQIHDPLVRVRFLGAGSSCGYGCECLRRGAMFSATNFGKSRAATRAHFRHGRNPSSSQGLPLCRLKRVRLALRYSASVGAASLRSTPSMKSAMQHGG